MQIKKGFNLISSLFFIFVAGCIPTKNQNTPDPQDLLNLPQYKERIAAIDRQRLEADKMTFSELLKKNRITKIDNGTKPILIVVDRIRPKEKDGGVLFVDEEGNTFYDPTHDKVQVEEYYILTDDDGAPLVEGQNRNDFLEEDESAIEPEALEELEPEIQEVTSPGAQKSDRPPLENSTSEDEKKEGFVKNQDRIPVNKETKVKAAEEDVIDSSPILKSSVPRAPIPRAKPELPPKTENKQSVESKENRILQADWDKDLKTLGPLYKKLLLEAIDNFGSDLLNPFVKMKKDGYARYCSNYNSLNKEERREFWLMMISGLTRLESGFDTHTKYTESFKTKSGKRVVSRGLLQMSIGSVNNRYYKCNIKRAQNLHDPATNFNCAVKIMNRWVKKDRRLYGRQFVRSKNNKKISDWFGLANYWGPIRTEAQTGKRKKRNLKLGRKTNGLSICKQ